MLSLFNNPFQDFNFFTDPFTRQVERTFRKPFGSFDIFERDIFSLDEDNDIDMGINDENLYYKKKVVINNNGHVKVKTVEKKPGSDWNVSVKKFNKGKALKNEANKMIEADNDQKVNEIDNKEEKMEEITQDEKTQPLKKQALKKTSHGKQVASKKKPLKTREEKPALSTIMEEFESFMDEAFDNISDVFENSNQNKNKISNEKSQAKNKTPKKVKKNVNTVIEEVN